MLYKDYKEKAFDDLDAAHKEYNQVVKEASDLYDKVNYIKGSSYTLITEAQQFISGIRRGPFTFTKELNIIKKQKEKFQKSEEIRCKEQREKLAGGAGAVMVLGAGAFAAVSFWDYIDSKLGSKLKKLFGKNVLASLIIGILVLIFLGVLIIGWTVSNYRAGKKAERQTIEIKKKTEDLRKDTVAAHALIKIMNTQYKIVAERLASLAEITGMTRKELTDEQYSNLKNLVYETVGLSELLNK